MASSTCRASSTPSTESVDLGVVDLQSVEYAVNRHVELGRTTDDEDERPKELLPILLGRVTF